MPLTSSEALNNATLPFGLALAAKGLAANAANPHLAAGLNVRRGRLTHKAAAESLGLPYAPAEQVIAATGSSSAIETVPYDSVYPVGFEDMVRRLPDVSRLESVTGFRPRRTLAQIISDIVEEKRAQMADGPVA